MTVGYRSNTSRLWLPDVKKHPNKSSFDPRLGRSSSPPGGTKGQFITLLIGCESVRWVGTTGTDLFVSQSPSGPGGPLSSPGRLFPDCLPPLPSGGFPEVSGWSRGPGTVLVSPGSGSPGPGDEVTGVPGWTFV